MNTFKVTLSGFGASHVEAERYEEAGGVVRFYRKDSIVSEYSKSMIKEIVPLGGLRAEVPVERTKQTDSQPQL